MSKFGSKEEILSAIQSIFENIQSGRLTADEMDSLVELTRELNERALILRYKSYEEKIFGTAPATFETLFEAQNTSANATEITETIDPTPEITEPVQQTETEPEAAAESNAPSLGFEQVEEEILQSEKTPVAEEPVFDFDMFEKAEANIFTPVADETPETVEPALAEPVFHPVSQPETTEETPAPAQPQELVPSIQ
jgi:flagellar biosynthesis GTPase FlhF